MQARARLLLAVIVALITLTFLFARILSFARLFFEHSGIALTQAQVKDEFTRYAVTGGVNPMKQLIPKHIHQVYHDWSHKKGGGDGEYGNATMPKDWEEVRTTCTSLNPDWEYTLWTDQMSREFIEVYYPDFLGTYDGYAYPVQRVDSVKYFILRHYGGIYIDLDNGCLENLDPLLYYPTWTTDGGHGALSNNILASVPQHPFWILLTDSLISYNWNYFFPYITISYASGQWFQTAIWEKYHLLLQKPRKRGSVDDKQMKEHWHGDALGHGEKEVAEQKEKQLYRIMMDSRPEADPWIFFTQHRGETWVNWDNDFFLWIGDHLILLGMGILVLLWLLWYGGRWCVRRGNAKRNGYRRVTHDSE